MTVRRRMILQLTALVDLLFIVMFLQYMELQEASERQLRGESVRRRIAEAAQDDANKLKESALANTEAMTRRLHELQSENQSLQQKLQDASKRLAVAAVEQQAGEKRAAADLQAIAGVVREMMGVPPESLVAVLGPAPEAERAMLRRRFEELRAKPPGQLVRHLRETAELKKYCEVWEAHIFSDNSVRLRVGADEGVAGDRFFIRSADEMANRLVAAAKDQGEPKSLVIVCLTWGDADLRTRDLVTNGLRFAITALKPEWGGSKRIEFARLGYAEVP